MGNQQLKLFTDQEPYMGWKALPPVRPFRTKRAVYSHWAVIEEIVPDDHGDQYEYGPAVWGVGKTRGDALSDSFKYLKAANWMLIHEMDDLELRIKCGDLLLLPCSHRVYYNVLEYGGALSDLVVNQPTGIRFAWEC